MKRIVIALSACCMCVAATAAFADAPAPVGEATNSLGTNPLPVGIYQGWYGQVMKDILTSEYHIKWQERDGAYQSPNRAQNLRFTYFDDGFAAAPREESDNDWKVKMALSSYGRTGGQEAFVPGRLMAAGDQARSEGSGLTIRYKNGPEGMRQDFVVEREPLGQGQLMLVFSVEKSAVSFECSDGRGLSFVMDQPGGAVVYRYSDMKVYDAGGQALPGRMERMDDNGFAILVDDSRAAYPVTIDPLSTSPDWTAESNQASSYYGISVACAGDVNGDGYSDIIVGAYQYDHGQNNEGAAFVYHGSASVPSASANWTGESNMSGARYGKSVSTAGDVDGDGFSDVIVGADSYTNGQASEGRAFVYHGSSTGLSASADWYAESNQTTAFFGCAVSTAGDVDGDGYSDVIVGAYSYDNGQTNEGRAYVYHGSASGLSASANWTAESNQAMANYGNSVSCSGDVNGDGYSDVVIGSYMYDNVETNEGRAFVYHGSAAGLSTSANWTAEPNQASAYYGQSVSSAGDVNGDGYADILIGAPNYENGQTDEGRAFVYHGSAAGLSTSANWTAESNQAEAYFGWEVATAGDVNGDGYADVLVGAPYYENGQTDEGRTFAYHGSAAGLSASANWTAESNQDSAYYGKSVSTAGDVNGDGHSDVVIGAPNYGNGQAVEGCAYVYCGSASGLSANAGWTAEPNQTQAEYGYSVAYAGDVNGDGYSDVIIGAQYYDNGQTNEGRAYVYHGSASGLSATANWMSESNQENAWYGYSVYTAGDVNGDGFSDVVVGAPRYSVSKGSEGRAYVFHGSSTGLSATANWTAESSVSASDFAASVSTAGDVNGDGYSDLIVGAPRYNGVEAEAGRAFVYHGSQMGLSVSPDWTVAGDQYQEHLGQSVAGAGDANGDGYSDVIVGAPGFDLWQGGVPTYADIGIAFIFHGSESGLSQIANWRADSAHPLGYLHMGSDAWYGQAVASAGDFNGDGLSDMAIGAPNFNISPINTGAIHLMLGSSSGDYFALSPGFGDQEYERLGSTISAGDVNADGYSDLIVGAPGYSNGQTGEGRICIWYGRSSTAPLYGPNWTAEMDQAEAKYGASVSAVGDVNGDGYSDVIAGAPLYDNSETNEGRAFLFYGNEGGNVVTRPQQLRQDFSAPIVPPLFSGTENSFGARIYARSSCGRMLARVQYEVKALGVPFNGTGFVESEWSDLGTVGQQVSGMIDGLTANTLYKWRARIKYHPKYGVPIHSRWYYNQSNALNESDFRTGVYVGVEGEPATTPCVFAGEGACRVHPNPFRQSTTVHYQLATARQVKVGVYNVFGQLVRTLASGHRPAGYHRVAWDGRNDRGRRVSAGVYLVRLEGAGVSKSARVAVIR